MLVQEVDEFRRSLAVGRGGESSARKTCNRLINAFQFNFVISLFAIHLVATLKTIAR